MQKYEHPNGNGTQKFDWTPGGLDLLDKIQRRIKWYGGANRLYNDMIKETRPILTMPNREVPVSNLSVVFNHIDKLSAEDIGKKIGKSQTTVLRYIGELGLKKIRATNYGNGQKVHIRQWVLNVETGIYYENMVKAAETTNMKLSVFHKQVRGMRKVNKTAFRLV